MPSTCMFKDHLADVGLSPAVVAGSLRFSLCRNNDSKDPITGEVISEDDLVDVKTCTWHLLAMLLSLLPASPFRKLKR